MADPYIGEIRMFAGTFAPVGWAFCHGQPLPISEYENLFNLIGTTYGGDGQSTFNLPDLRGRAPLHHDGQHLLGEIGGAEAVTLAAQHVPPHTHLVLASSQAANAGTVSGKVTATTAGATKLYAFASGSPATNMSANAVAAVGAGMPHENRMPYMAVHFIIALTGQYPTQF